MSRDEQSDIKDVGGFVGGYLSGGTRKTANVMWRSVATLDIDYGTAEAHTTYGCIGVKVWIYKGEVLPEAKKSSKKEEGDN